MNKGFAEIYQYCSLKNMECKYLHRVQLRFFRVLPCPSMYAGTYYNFYYSSRATPPIEPRPPGLKSLCRLI